jgi:cytochrome c biogenesis protein CcmG, thiol:disulfide interchange protein DsbE
MKRGMLRYVIPAVFFAALLTVFYFSLGRDKQTLPSPLIGKPAPIFELPTVEDPAEKFSNRALAGQMYAVNVWGTWCVGCRQEHGALLEIARQNEIPIVGLNWNDELALAQRWLRELGNPYVVNAFDGEGRVAIDFGSYAAPETFLVDAQGNIIFKHAGPLSLEIWSRDFMPLIRNAKEASS